MADQTETEEKRAKQRAILKSCKLKQRKVDRELSKDMKILKIKLKFTNRRLVKLFAIVRDLMSEVNFLKRDIVDLKTDNANLQNESQQPNFDSFVDADIKPTMVNFVSCRLSDGLYDSESADLDQEVRYVKTECVQPTLDKGRGGQTRDLQRKRQFSNARSSSEAAEPCTEETDVVVSFSTSAVASHPDTSSTKAAGSTDWQNQSQSYYEEPMFSDGEADFAMVPGSSKHGYAQDLSSRRLNPRTPSLGPRSRIPAERGREISSNLSVETGDKTQEDQSEDALFTYEVRTKQLPGGGNRLKRKSQRTKEKLYKCTDCSAKFRFKYMLDNHKGLHSLYLSEKSYKCEACGEEFGNRAGLCLHRRKSHPDQKFLKCIICGEKFYDRASLRSHRATHGDKPYMCSYCGVGFASKSYLMIHEKGHTGERPYKCEVCGAGFVCPRYLRNHSVIHTGEKPYICNVCGERFVRSSALKVHMRKHTGEKPYTCVECNASYRSISSFNRHKETHSRDNSNQCQICRTRFSDPESLQNHMKVHESQKTFPCDLCNKGFMRRANLIAHKRTHTGEKPYECLVCNAKFMRKSTLSAHERKHAHNSGQKRYNCGVCSSEFENFALLKSHRKLHQSEKSFICEFCGTSFATAGTLQCHRRRHTGEKPFMCKVCGLKFAQTTTLRRHMRIHTGEKPYECDICGFRSAVKSNLVKHKKSHSKEKIHVCDICGAGFTYEKSLEIHKRNHTGEKPYVCEICNVGFACRDYLTGHYRKTHKKNAVSL